MFVSANDEMKCWVSLHFLTEWAKCCPWLHSQASDNTSIIESSFGSIFLVFQKLWSSQAIWPFSGPPKNQVLFCMGSRLINILLQSQPVLVCFYFFFFHNWDILGVAWTKHFSLEQLRLGRFTNYYGVKPMLFNKMMWVFKLYCTM